ncbi:ribosome-associated translation inhibitor RaiA [Peptococcaceae bacterium]|nr:ribosome-associated translation inhibitor RaiA [Peptococcaceae bacterium]
MNINVRGKNVEVTPALKSYVEKRVGKLKRFFDGLGDAEVKLEIRKNRHKVEVTIPVNGMILRGEEATADMYASVDLVVEKLERQIERYKGKLYEKKARAASAIKAPEPLEKDKSEEDKFKIVKTKRFAIKPMAVEEAVMQMNLLGHNFFVFMNAETEQVNVVYVRKDGNYGLIEPTF